MDFSSDEMLLEVVISELYTTGHYTRFGSYHCRSGEREKRMKSRGICAGEKI